MQDRYIFKRYEYAEPPSLSITMPDGIELDFFMTCSTCPEQYDVFLGTKQIGYVRLRGARLQAAYPNVDADYSFVHHFSSENDYWKGRFYSDNERNYWLDCVGKHLYNKFLESEVVP
jgi:hypothetical protein